MIVDGDFDRVENLMQQALQERLFDEYIKNAPLTFKWDRINIAQGKPWPSMRGGHQMCIDTESGIIYLIGGWDGSKELADFWAFHEKEQFWECISEDTRKFFQFLI